MIRSSSNTVFRRRYAYCSRASDEFCTDTAGLSIVKTAHLSTDVQNTFARSSRASSQVNETPDRLHTETLKFKSISNAVDIKRSLSADKHSSSPNRQLRNSRMCFEQSLYSSGSTSLCRIRTASPQNSLMHVALTDRSTADESSREDFVASQKKNSPQGIDRAKVSRSLKENKEIVENKNKGKRNANERSDGEPPYHPLLSSRLHASLDFRVSNESLLSLNSEFQSSSATTNNHSAKASLSKSLPSRSITTQLDNAGERHHLTSAIHSLAKGSELHQVPKNYATGAPAEASVHVTNHSSLSFIKGNSNETRVVLDHKNRKIDELSQQLQHQRDIHRRVEVESETQYKNTIEQLRLSLKHEAEQRQKTDIVASIRQKQYQDILKDMATYEEFMTWSWLLKRLLYEEVQSKTSAQLEYAEAETFRMRQLLADLKFENEQIRQIVIQKEKEILHLKHVDGTSSEISALELSVKAISMIDSEKKLKEEIQTLQVELANTKNVVDKVRRSYDDAVCQLEKKCAESHTLLETLAERNLHISNLETKTHYNELQREQKQQETENALNREKEKCLQLADEAEIVSQQNVQLHQELAQRDSLILTLKSEIVRQSTYNKNAELQLLKLAKLLPKRVLSVNTCVSELNSREKDGLNTHHQTSRAPLFQHDDTHASHVVIPRTTENNSKTGIKQTHVGIKFQEGIRVSTVRRPTLSSLNKQVVYELK